MPKKIKMISVTVSLLELLMAEPEDLKDPKMYKDMRETAKAMTRLLITANEGE